MKAAGEEHDVSPQECRLMQEQVMQISDIMINIESLCDYAADHVEITGCMPVLIGELAHSCKKRCGTVLETLRKQQLQV